MKSPSPVMNFAWAPVAMAGVLAITAACGTSDSKLPGPVAAGVEQLARMCRDAGGTPSTERALLRADLNADGHDDYVLQAGGMNCEGAAGIYGDREKEVTVFVGDTAGGATQAFTDAVFDLRLEGSGRDARLWLTLSGRQCGKAPARDFASENFCERAIDWNAGSGNFAYAPVTTVRMIR